MLFVADDHLNALLPPDVKLALFSSNLTTLLCRPPRRLPPSPLHDQRANQKATTCVESVGQTQAGRAAARANRGRRRQFRRPGGGGGWLSAGPRSCARRSAGAVVRKGELGRERRCAGRVRSASNDVQVHYP